MASRLEQVYTWRHAQTITLATGCFSLAGLILSPLLAAVFDADTRIDAWQALMFVAGALLSAVSGLVWHTRAARVSTEYLALPAGDGE